MLLRVSHCASRTYHSFGSGWFQPSDALRRPTGAASDARTAITASRLPNRLKPCRRTPRSRHAGSRGVCCFHQSCGGVTPNSYELQTVSGLKCCHFPSRHFTLARVPDQFHWFSFSCRARSSCPHWQNAKPETNEITIRIAMFPKISAYLTGCPLSTGSDLQRSKRKPSFLTLIYLHGAHCNQQ